MRRTATVVALALALTGAAARADELRMKDGEVVFGKVSKTEKGRVHVETPAGLRKLREASIVERIEGPAPAEVLRDREFALRTEARFEGDPGVLADLASCAWQHRLEEDATRLAQAALAADPELPLANRVLGRVRLEDRCGGRVFVTGLCVLMLQTPCRHPRTR